ncbi:MAG: flagellar hook-associated protein FlgL [Hyphomonadaceae bacterium]|nr:flagellar hook-associated protein FlgL [Clostridia bacterium]
MRITNAMLVANFGNSLNKNTSKLDKLQTQVATQKKNFRASDDSIAAGKSMRIRTSLSKVEQYTNNVIEAQEWMGQTESSLDEMNSLLSRIYEQADKGANGTNGAEERIAIANEVEQLTQQILVAANTSFSGRYVFGGANTTQKPFEVKDVSGESVLFYNENNVNDLSQPANAATLESLSSQSLNYQLGLGANMDISFNGIDVMGFGDNNMFAILNNLKNALENNDSEGISASIDLVQGKQEKVLSLLGEVGGKSNRLDFFTSRLETDEYNYKTMLSQVDGIEVEKSIMELKMQEMVFEAAMSVGSKIISKTLVDFIG